MEKLISVFKNSFYYFAQYTEEDLPSEGNNYVKDRTIILTRFPAKFLNLKYTHFMEG